MTIQVVRPEDQELRALGENPDIAGAEGASEEARRVVGRQLISRSDPHVHISRLPAGRVGPVHHHTEDEVMVVLDGSVKINGLDCGTGSVALIPAFEPYGIEASASDGVTFAVIRTRPGEYRVDEPAAGAAR